eukprot:10035648-Alexandrium_andersonii.AAC.1
MAQLPCSWRSRSKSARASARCETFSAARPDSQCRTARVPVLKDSAMRNCNAWATNARKQYPLKAEMRWAESSPPRQACADP